MAAGPSIQFHPFDDAHPMPLVARQVPQTVPGETASYPLRILQVVPTYYPAVRYGGPIRSVHGLAAALVRRGHEVSVYTSSVDGDSDLDVPLGQPVDMDGVAVSYFPVSKLRRLYYSPAMAGRLTTTIADFDIVHLHSVYLWPTWAAARAAHKKHVPYLISPRGMLVRKLIRRKSRWIKTAWIQLIERRSFAQAAAIHVTAEVEADEIRSLRLPVRRTFCIANGVEWPRQHKSLAQGPFATLTEPYVLFLGRINWKKGIDRLIEAWKWIEGLRLVIAGNDEEDYQPQLQRLAHRLGVSERVDFIGPVSDQDKWALYENAVLFALPSHSENFGNTVAEAMAMGCPVVLTPEVGIAPLVAEFGAGLVSSAQPRILAEAISNLAVDAPRRAAMSKGGRLCAEVRLSWSAVACHMENAYRELAAATKDRLTAQLLTATAKS